MKKWRTISKTSNNDLYLILELFDYIGFRLLFDHLFERKSFEPRIKKKKLQPRSVDSKTIYNNKWISESRNNCDGKR